MPERKINIAIDGLSACGKSTLAKDLAYSLNYIHIDSGLTYRAITYFLLKQGINIQNPDEVAKALEGVNLSWKMVDNKNHLFINQKDVTLHLRTTQIDQNVSSVSTYSAVRKLLVTIQKELAHNKGVVMDGRDIGTVVLPDAELKIFLSADLDIRVNRRKTEITDLTRNFDEIKANLLQRDHLDSTRDDSPLTKAKDAIIIDNTNLTKEEQLSMVKALALCRIRH